MIKIKVYMLRDKDRETDRQGEKYKEREDLYACKNFFNCQEEKAGE